MKAYRIKFMAFLLLSFVAVACSSAEPQPPEGNYIQSSSDLSLLKGHWVFKDGGIVAEQGAYMLTGNQIKFTVEQTYMIVFDCDPPAKTFTYQWAFDGKSLTLTKLEDSCFLREVHLKGSWLYRGPAQ